MTLSAISFGIDPNAVADLEETRLRRQIGFMRLNQLSFVQIITSWPLFIAGVVTLLIALPHVEYPVFNFGPVILAILVFPMALTGLLATRSAQVNLNKIERTGVVKSMMVCNFVLSLLCCTLAAVSSFYSFLIVDQCSDSSSEYHELCLPNSRANVALSLVDGVACIILLVQSLLGILHFCTFSFKLCFNSDGETIMDHKDYQLAIVLPGQSTGHGQIQGCH